MEPQGGGGSQLDLTEYVSTATLTFSRPAAANQNTFGVGGQRRELKSIWDGSISLTFHHEYESSDITQTLWGWLEGDESIYMAVRAKDAPISADNPEWQFRVAVTELPVVDGGPEDIAAASVTWEIDGVPQMVTSES